jgi:alkanesulfonate monooxygenase SsuD/methylene tetrahydromethanopterin reductase-like flavin-dependent oxidoreductase (luciferase family)
MTNTNARPKVGVLLPEGEGSMDTETPRWSDILAMAQAAEDVGFDSIWLTDHLVFEDGGDRRGSWESWTLLSALAGTTTSVELGTFVSCVSFRNPALFAKMADTVDEVTGGRLILGLGAGWNEPEYRAFGFPFDNRVSRFEEAITIIAGLLKDGHIDFKGQYHEARDCELRPRGPRPGGPPLMIGTVRPRMLRIGARHAHTWNALSIRPKGVPPLMEKVDEACRDVGRDPATMGRTIETRVRFTELPMRAEPEADLLSGSPEDVAETLRKFGRLGVDHIQVRVRPNTVQSIEAFGSILEAIG